MATGLIKEKTVDMVGLQIDATQLKLGSTVISATELSELSDTPSFTSATITTLTAPTIAGATSFSGVVTFPSAGIVANATAVTAAELAFLAGASNANSGTGDAVVTGTSGALTVAGALTVTGGVAAAGGFSVSPRNWHTGASPAKASTDGTDQTTVNTEVYIAEVFVPANATVTGIAIFNGSAAANNVKVGLANSAGAVVATSASTAHTGNDQYQLVPFTGTYAAKGPATYYVLTFYDTNAAQANAHTVGTFGASKQTGQTYATGFTTITPPTTFTTALGPIASLY